MLKGRYQAWMISIALHGVVLYFLMQYKVVSSLPTIKQDKVIQAYVSVDLSTLPSLNNDKANDPVKKASDTQQNTLTQSEKLPANSTTQGTASQAEKAIITSKTQTTATIQDENKQHAKKVKGLKFKKINPHVAVPKLTEPSERHKTFGYADLTEQNKQQRITVPAVHSGSQKVIVLSQSVDGSNRVEQQNGQCYKIDYNSVFGKSGLPSGSPRPCEDKDQLLFDTVMSKYKK